MEKTANKLDFQDVIGHVKDFHNAFGIDNNEKPTVLLSEKDYMLRYNLMHEENGEYLQAC